MKVLVIMDEVENVIVDEDTSFSIMHEFQERQHEVYHVLMNQISLLDGDLIADAQKANMIRRKKYPIVLDDFKKVNLDDFDLIWIRKDPPFNANYSWLTLILEHLRGKVLIANDPRGLRDANEKLYACHFPNLMPKTLVTADRDLIKNFLDEVGGKAVIKPIDGHGGEGIFFIHKEDHNLNVILSTLTNDGKNMAMVQEFIKEVEVGDKRILIIGDQILGAILRVPQQGELRSNIHVGGRVEKTEITQEERKLVEELLPKLQKDGLYFVGLDVIGGKLTEVNVTSPTGIQQMSRLDGVNYEKQVVEWFEEKVKDFQQGI